MGPLDVSVSGCGNCLLVQVSLPKSKGLQQHQQFQSFYRVIDFNVQRTRDGVQFKLKLPYKEENMITYLQPGVEYCVTVSVSSPFNSNSVPSKPFCAFTSPPPRNLLYMVYGLLGAFCVLGFLLMGLVVHGGRLSYQLLGQRIPRNPSKTLKWSFVNLMTVPVADSDPLISSCTSLFRIVEVHLLSSQTRPQPPRYIIEDLLTASTVHSPVHPLRSSSEQGEEDRRSHQKCLGGAELADWF
eukprot:superscaffoldBa00002502_g14489